MLDSKLLPLTQSPKKICILRLSAIGDVTHVLPVVRAIQQQWPEAEITWICGKFEYKLLHIIEGIRFICFDKSDGYKEYFRLWRALRGEVFDVLLQMQVAARANLASFTINSKVRLGWDNHRSKDLHKLSINQRIPEHYQQHQVQGFLSFARTLGIQVDDPDWCLPITEVALNFAEKYIDKTKRVLVISACSSHPLRNWAAERYAELADYAIEKYDMQVVLSGGPSDIEVNMARDIMECMTQQALNLVGKDTLEQLVGLLGKANVVISPDSGPAHIANAVGVPVIGLYACTWSRRSGPYNSLEYCVDKFEIAAEKFLNESADKLRWGTKIEKAGVMDLILVEDVKQQLDKVLAKNI